MSKRLSSKLFSEQDLPVGESVLEPINELSIMSEVQHQEFRVLRGCNLKDASGTVKGQLQSGAKVTGDLGSKKRVIKRSINSEEIWAINIIKPVDGWISMSNYKGEIILEPIVTTEASEVFTEEEIAGIVKITVKTQPKCKFEVVDGKILIT